MMKKAKKNGKKRKSAKGKRDSKRRRSRKEKDKKSERRELAVDVVDDCAVIAGSHPPANPLLSPPLARSPARLTSRYNPRGIVAIRHSSYHLNTRPRDGRG